MNWEDTVMNEEQIDKICLNEPMTPFDHSIRNKSVLSCGTKIAQAQAEIAFKAGQESTKEGHEAISYLEGYQEGKKAGEDKGYAQARNHCEDVLLPQERLAGIKEVVEWIEEHTYPDGTYEWTDLGWQRQCKEWGIDG